VLVATPKTISSVLITMVLALGCAKKEEKKTEDSPNGSTGRNDQNVLNSTIEAIPAVDDKKINTSGPSYKTEITVNGILHTSYYNRAIASPYFQSSTELKDLFPDISNPRTSQLCLPTIMSYELYTQLTAKPALLSSQAETHLMKPINDQVREMYKVCETDRFRGTTAPQAANCAVKAAFAMGLVPQVHVIGVDAKWKDGGYYIDSVSTDLRALKNEDIINSVANQASAMFLIGFYETTDGVKFTRIGGHFVSITATGRASNDTNDALRAWIVDPALPGNEKAGTANPFNATITPVKRSNATNLDPMISKEIVDSKLEAAGLKIFIESEIRFSMSRE
jgi:hypothetical protein